MSEVLISLIRIFLLSSIASFYGQTGLISENSTLSIILIVITGITGDIERVDLI